MDVRIVKMMSDNHRGTEKGLSVHDKMVLACVHKLREHNPDLQVLHITWDNDHPFAEFDEIDILKEGVTDDE
jgi:hypothetical protein